MKRFFATLLLVIAGFAVTAQNLPDQQNPPMLVNDFASILTPGQRSALEDKLVAFDRSTSTQIAVVTVNDLDGMAASDYAQRLHDKWGVGGSKDNNGVLILVKPKVSDSRGEAFISVGYGLEGVLPDITAGRIIDAEMIPAFSRGEYYGGIDAAADVIMKIASGEFPASDYEGRSEPANDIITIIIIFLFIIFMIIGSRRRRGGNNGNNGGGRGWVPPVIIGGMPRSGGFGSSGSGGGFGGFGGGRSGGGGAGRSWMVALTVMILGFTSCDKQELEVYPPDDVSTSRTVLVYMASDNNLSRFAGPNLTGMQTAMKEVDDGNLIVYLDQPGANSYLLKIDHDGTRKIIATYGDEDSASPEVLKKVVADVVEAYPADSYGLVLWSHGLGWLPSGSTVRSARGFSAANDVSSMWYRDPAAEMTKYFGVDDTSGTEMDITDLVEALEDAPVFDFILFDACFMAGVEVLYEMRGVTDYIISSPTEVMGAGFPYAKVVPHMFNKNNQWKNICDAFVDYYAAQPDYPSASVSLVKTSELSALATVIADMDAYRTVPAANVNGIQYFERLSTHMFFDLDDYISGIATTGQYSQFTAQLAKTVVYKKSTPTIYSVYSGSGFFSITNYSGISTYIPRSGLSIYNTSFYATSWANAVNAQP